VPVHHASRWRRPLRQGPPLVQTVLQSA